MNQVIQAFFTKAFASLEAAELLGEQGFYGFAVSRAYYAMFYAAEALLYMRNLSFKSHSGVIAAFGKEFSKTKELDPKYHRYLMDAEDYRYQGDYAVGKEVTHSQYQESIIWAREFIAAAQSYLAKN
jgi:uncharacterized protein (UPF0332 family)